jgi:hypothetical protein
LVIECLHLLNQPRLIQCAAICYDAHRLGHLQRRDLRVSLADGHVCDIAVKQFAAVRCLHVFIVWNAALRFAAQRDAALRAEA